MTTSRNNTIMSWMAYTDFLSRLQFAAGILLPLNTRTLLLYPRGEGRAEAFDRKTGGLSWECYVWLRHCQGGAVDFPGGLW